MKIKFSYCFVVVLVFIMSALLYSVDSYAEIKNPVGFVVHPHEANYDQLNQTDATGELSNIFVWRMKDEKNQIVDFSVAKTWLDRLYESDRNAYPILDTGIHHSDQPWQVELWKQTGSSIIGSDGKLRTYASFHSQEFRKVVYNYIDQLIEWVVANDTKRQIPAYVDGAEWFWPWGDLDYSEPAFAAFRDWLKDKYGDLEELNGQWGSAFKSWEDVEPLRATIVGDAFAGMTSVSFDGPRQCAWESPAIDVKPSSNYQLKLKVSSKDVPEGLVVAKFLWTDENEKLLSDNPPYKGDLEGYALNMADQKSPLVTLVTKSPVNAKKLKLSLMVCGQGMASFSDIELYSYPEGALVLSDANSEQWKPYNSLEAKSQVIKKDGKNIFSIEVPKMRTPYKYPSIAWEDWDTFSFEAMAGWLNTTAAHIKEKDPTRLVSSYVGWVFGSHSMWEGCMTIQRLDVSLANTPNIEINGIQTCIAGDDFTYATFPVDMARKYNKPIYLTDMIDFPYGFYSGFSSIYKGYLAALQHGMDGVFGYCWYANWPPAYNYYSHLTSTQVETLISDTRKGIEMLDGYQLETKVAFIEPLMTYSLADKDGRKGDNLDCAGLYHLVLDSGYMPDVITVYELEKNGASILDNYDMLFISDCPVLKESVSKTLKGFVDRGGVLVSSGSLPVYDLKYNKLADMAAANALTGSTYTDDVKEVAKSQTYNIGKGKIVNFPYKVGRKYWGRVRRWRQAGNTPQVYMRLDTSKDDLVKRGYIRDRFVDAVKSSGFDMFAAIMNPSGNVHLAYYKSEDKNDVKLFLVNKGLPQRSVDIKLSIALPEIKKISAIVDFDKSYELDLVDGFITTPAFADSLILEIK